MPQSLEKCGMYLLLKDRKSNVAEALSGILVSIEPEVSKTLEYIKNVIDKNIPLIREWINNVQTVDDAITVLNQRIVTLPHIYVPYMCHIRAFLYAKNNDIDNAIESIKQGYENSEIPQVIIDKLVQIANG